jgi:hypothetical protein
LDALYKTYTVNDHDGKIRYGKKFHSSRWFSHAHLSGAGTSDCDHWHDDAGIAVHHIAVTLVMEQTLQSINPSIAMPYWEYPLVSLALAIQRCNFLLFYLTLHRTIFFTAIGKNLQFFKMTGLKKPHQTQQTIRCQQEDGLMFKYQTAASILNGTSLQVEA